MFSPIGSRPAAMAWILVWKFMDVVSTDMMISRPGAYEMNPLINATAPIIGFEAALVLTVMTSLFFGYIFYYSLPIIVEVLALYIPVAVIGNLSILVHPVLNNLVVLTGIISLIGYITYCRAGYRRQDHSVGEARLLRTAVKN